MPNETAHIRQANKNDEALKHLMTAGTKFPEWITTIAFYKAVHIVEALLFCQHSRHSHDHTDRLTTLLRLYPNLYKQYRPLCEASMVARYLCDNCDDGKTYTSFTDYLSADDVVKKLVHSRLVRVEQIALMQLSDAAKNELAKTHMNPST
jgi:hypothetical protein